MSEEPPSMSEEPPSADGIGFSSAEELGHPGQPAPQPLDPESSPAPEAGLSPELARKLYVTASDLGKRTLPLGTRLPYSEQPYYELPSIDTPSGPMERTITTRSLSFEPNVRGVTYTTYADDTSRDITLRTAGTSAGSFRVETEAQSATGAHKIGLDYTAPDPGKKISEQVIFFDTARMTPDQTQLAADDPHQHAVLAQLLVDVQSAADAVTEFETIEAENIPQTAPNDPLAA